MNAIRTMGLALILAGVLGLIFDHFSFTKQTQEAKLGPLELSVKAQKTVDIPQWLGISAIVVGGVLLLMGGKRN